ncbi:MAG: hypothetical protein HKM89_14460 [Gemmatimonadales bacterium]|nr:hypothetical protein [Gemmatimonadales bacterium]
MGPAAFPGRAMTVPDPLHPRRAMTHGQNPERAFRWIVGILEDRAIPFLLVGGLAARAHGASRDLADIDFYIPGERFPDIVAAASEYVTAGPEHVVSEHWDITFMKLEYAGQPIEVGAADHVRIFSRPEGKWVPERVDLEDADVKEVFGLPVPVMTRERLLAYKQRLQRPVDLADIRELEA